MNLKFAIFVVLKQNNVSADWNQIQKISIKISAWLKYLIKCENFWLWTVIQNNSWWESFQNKWEWEKSKKKTEKNVKINQKKWF